MEDCTNIVNKISDLEGSPDVYQTVAYIQTCYKNMDSTYLNITWLNHSVHTPAYYFSFSLQSTYIHNKFLI